MNEVIEPIAAIDRLLTVRQLKLAVRNEEVLMRMYQVNAFTDRLFAGNPLLFSYSTTGSRMTVLNGRKVNGAKNPSGESEICSAGIAIFILR
ncbi:hypothetical protein [Mesorhizobium sp. M0859]|uniref:hypothetical protein n=1 Tax=Mesorhizobium sp. M0859 TaxID=2957014 RepID=UPI003336DA5C